MYCKNCGENLNPNAKACLGCGFLVGDGVKFCNHCGNELKIPNSKLCMSCGREVTRYSDKSKMTAGILGLLIGSFGIHRFYLGYTGIGVLMLFLTLFGFIGAAFFPPLAFVSWWGVIEGILILTGSFNKDADGNLLR